MFRFACSVVLRGGRAAADKCPRPVWGALPVFRPHWVCPAQGCVLSPSTLLRLPAALQGAGPALRALTRPEPLRFGFSGAPQRRRLGWAAGSQELDGHALPGWRAPSPLRGPGLGFRRSGAPCVSSRKLISGCDPPGGCRPSRISGSLWLGTGSLLAAW